MSRVIFRTVLLLGLAVLVAGCSGRGSPTGFRLPAGDIAGGQKAFGDLGCNNCHTIPGVDLPVPAGATTVALGGRVILPPTDGDLTTDIILPSSHFATGYPATQVQEGSHSKMPDYTQKMTVRQLADLVAFLQTKYSVAVATK